MDIPGAASETVSFPVRMRELREGFAPVREAQTELQRFTRHDSVIAGI